VTRLTNETTEKPLVPVTPNFAPRPNAEVAPAIWRMKQHDFIARLPGQTSNDIGFMPLNLPLGGSTLQ